MWVRWSGREDVGGCAGIFNPHACGSVIFINYFYCSLSLLPVHFFSYFLAVMQHLINELPKSYTTHTLTHRYSDRYSYRDKNSYSYRYCGSLMMRM